MLELGEYAKAYREAHQSWANFQASIDQDPSTADIYTDAQAQAVVIMELMEERAAADFIPVLSPVVDENIERQRRIIQSIRETKPYRDGLIAEAEIEARLAAVPEPEQYSEDNRNFATGFFICRTLARVLQVRQRTEDVAAPAPGPAQGEVGGTPEADIYPKPLHIKAYTKDSVLMLNDESAVSMRRKLAAGNQSAEEEEMINGLRLSALQFLAAHPEERFVASQIWDAIAPGQEYSTNRWYTQIGDFLANDLMYHNRSLVLAQKPKDMAKIRYYQLNPDFSITLEVLDEASGTEQLTYYKLPNGKLLRGKEGMVMNIMERTSPDALFTDEVLLAKGIYTPEELQKLKSAENILSNTMSSLKLGLRRAGMGDLFTFHRVDQPGSQKALGYWMEHAQDITERERDMAERIHRAHIVAAFIYERTNLLVRLQLPVLSAAIVAALRAADTIAQQGPEELDAQQRDIAYERLRSLVQNPEELEELMNSDKGNPLWPIVDYLFNILTEEDSRGRFEEALQAPVTRVLSAETAAGAQEAPVDQVEYELGIQRVLIERPDASGGSFGEQLIAAPNQTTPPVRQIRNAQGHRINHSRQRDDARANRRARRGTMGENYHDLEARASSQLAELMDNPDHSTMLQLGASGHEVVQRLPQITEAFLVSFFSDRQITRKFMDPERILLAYLATCSDETIQQAASIRSQRARLREHISRVVQERAAENEQR